MIETMPSLKVNGRMQVHPMFGSRFIKYRIDIEIKD